jgi:branched-chain amino acid transport system substrate-binding protein
VFTDTFRPGQEQQVALVRRLAKAGATHVFVGGDRNDVSIIARDAASEKVALSLIAGDTMRAANRPVPLRDGVMAVALPDYSTLPSASKAVASLRAKNIDPDGYTLPAYAATELAHQAISASDGKAATAAIAAGRFTTAIGPIAFDKGHELKDNPFRLLEWRGSALVLSHPVTE